jgi:hypothetical protein
MFRASDVYGLAMFWRLIGGRSKPGLTLPMRMIKHARGVKTRVNRQIVVFLDLISRG